ncbi:MAG: hypothetical protein UY72_C0013G0025 [Candidatus Uhrbacteria bacterium GW2011_GWD2_52_7]|uniref:DoxX family protein n=1 Tax=Candidatus Uhrbacteria bacterium GW2011_GWD2_52_7 TaxID=1618989 RepID=A0A0G1XHM8_9BACT|nr:MAG: hypothetical protein UY72_C0013G0025 [Candidatus Uhrbacteria bacterium GW2011_GWD2_52_7]
MRTQTGFGKIGGTANHQAFGVMLAFLRVLLGVQFFFAGWSKLTTDWSAEGYLSAASGPFAEWFHSMAGSALVDGLNAWGLTLVGIALVLGLAVRPASFAGAAFMVLYYFAGYTDNTSHGLIEYHLVYATVFVLFMTGGAGNVFGLNTLVLGNMRKPNVWWKALLG